MEPRLLETALRPSEQRTYLIRRRAARGTCAIQGTPEHRRLCGFTYAWTLERTVGVSPHGVVYMPDGFWTIVTDGVQDVHADGVVGVPDFNREHNRLLAQNLNLELENSGEAFWAAGSYDAIELLSEGDLVDALAEMALLPLSRGLIRREEEYPLVHHPATAVGRSIVYTCPEAYRRVAAPVPPAHATLELNLPPAVDAAARDDFFADYANHYARRKEEIRAGRLHFLGAAALETIEPERPLEPPDIPKHTPAGRPRPAWENHFADSSDERRAGRGRRELDEFRAEYRECRRELRARIRSGERADVVFPAGTWGLARSLGVPVRGSPPVSSDVDE